MSKRNEAVVAFLQNLSIETTRFGGFDKEDVFIHLKALSDLYEQEREALLQECQTLTSRADLANVELQKSDRIIASLQVNLDKATEQCALLQNKAAVSSKVDITPAETPVAKSELDLVLYSTFINEFQQFSAEKRATAKLSDETYAVREQLLQCRDAIERILQ